MKAIMLIKNNIHGTKYDIYRLKGYKKSNLG